MGRRARRSRPNGNRYRVDFGIGQASRILYITRFTFKVRIMSTTISSKGQITVPANIREALGLLPGTKIILELGSKGTFVARKALDGSFFSTFQGIGKKAKVPYRDSRAAMDVLRGSAAKGDLDWELRP
jgi:antitoxin PrlF